MSRKYDKWSDDYSWLTQLYARRRAAETRTHASYDEKLRQERLKREQETARLKAELEEVKKQIKCLTTFMANQGQVFAAFVEIESKKE